MPAASPPNEVDIYYPAPYGRLKRRTSPDLETHEAMKEMCLEWKAKKQYHYVKAVQDKRVTLSVAFHAWQRGELDQLYLDGPQYINPAYHKWCDEFGAKHDKSKATAEGYRHSFDMLLKRTTGSSIEQLPDMLAQYRKRCEKRQENRSYMKAKTAVQSFLRSTLGKGNPIYQACRDLEPLSTKAKNPTKGMTFQEVAKLLKKLPPRYQPILWHLCLTGMRPSEFFHNRFEVLADRIHVKGTKTTPSNRFVPLVEAPQKPGTTLKYFREQLKAAGGQTTYSTRKTAVKWWREAGIPGNRRRLYMGHSHGTQTEYYESEETQTSDLREDAEKLAAYINSQGKIKQDREPKKAWKPPTVASPY